MIRIRKLWFIAILLALLFGPSCESKIEDERAEGANAEAATSAAQSSAAVVGTSACLTEIHSSSSWCLALGETSTVKAFGEHFLLLVEVDAEGVHFRLLDVYGGVTDAPVLPLFDNAESDPFAAAEFATGFLEKYDGKILLMGSIVALRENETLRRELASFAQQGVREIGVTDASAMEKVLTRSVTERHAGIPLEVTWVRIRREDSGE